MIAPRDPSAVPAEGRSQQAPPVAYPSETIPAAEPGNEIPAEGLEERRRQRLDEYRRKALEHPDPLQANLALINAKLIELSVKMGAVIDEAMDRDSLALAHLGHLEPTVELLLKVDRQIDRFAQVAYRAEASAAARSSAGAQRQNDPLLTAPSEEWRV
jgi:hypothetical protein